MNIPILLAHGVLGPYDEIILPVIGGAFIGLILITWWNSRNARLPDDPSDDTTQKPTEPSIDDSDPSHYKLD